MIPNGEKEMRITKLVIFVILLNLFVTACGKGTPKQNTPVEPNLSPVGLLGAYYFPRAWSNDNLRQKLIPPQTPAIDNYDCRADATIKQHLEWANKTGIDFFVIQWWGQATNSDITIKQYLGPYLEHNKNPTKFCISYLTPYIHQTVNYETSLDNNSEAKLLVNLLYIASTYFKHPNYLRINNRPVVFLYLSRLLKCDYAKTFNRIRTIIKRDTKEDIYLIGDEIFWSEPNRDRIAQLDAITVSTMYGPDRYAGYAGETGFLKDIATVFAKYKKLADELKIGFIPNVMPGFNDHAIPGQGRVPFQENHYIIPRGFSLADKSEGSFYHAYFRIAKKYLAPPLNIAIINSWNDWREDTQIEPTKTSTLFTKQPKELTGDYDYGAYGEKYLTITREEKTSK